MAEHRITIKFSDEEIEEVRKRRDFHFPFLRGTRQTAANAVRMALNFQPKKWGGIRKKPRTL